MDELQPKQITPADLGVSNAQESQIAAFDGRTLKTLDGSVEKLTSDTAHQLGEIYSIDDASPSIRAAILRRTPIVRVTRVSRSVY